MSPRHANGWTPVRRWSTSVRTMNLRLDTRPVRFTGSHLFVNVNAGGGELRAEVLDAGATAIVTGSAVFGGPKSVAENIAALRKGSHL